MITWKEGFLSVMESLHPLWQGSCLPKEDSKFCLEWPWGKGWGKGETIYYHPLQTRGLGLLLLPHQVRALVGPLFIWALHEGDHP